VTQAPRGIPPHRAHLVPGPLPCADEGISQALPSLDVRGPHDHRGCVISGPETHLVFPPVLPLNEFPELGMPQVAGTLEQAGITFQQHDLNVELLYHYLVDDAWAARIQSATPAERRLPENDRVVPRFPLPARTAEQIHGLRLWAERCVEALGLGRRDYGMANVRRDVTAGHPVYDRFFADRFFDLVAPPRTMLGISLMSSEQLVPGLILAKMSKERWPGCAVVVGGPWAAAGRGVLQAFLREMPWIDAIVPGRGEQVVPALVRALASCADLATVPNLVFRRGDSVESCPARPALPLEECPTPSFDGLALDAYPVRMLPVQTTSRCYWGRCVFCYHDDQRIPLTYRDAARVVDDLESLLARHGVDSFFFADCATSVDTMVAISEELVRRNLRVGWSALARVDPRLTLEVCRTLRDGGCRVLLFGLESSSNAELAKLRKGISSELVASSVRACGEAGIASYLFVLDYPGHLAATFEQTLQFVVSLAPWLEDFIVSRFQLSELSRVDEAAQLFGIRSAIEREAWLDVFNVPFDAPAILPQAEYERLVRKYADAFLAARGKPRRDPFLVGMG